MQSISLILKIANIVPEKRTDMIVSMNLKGHAELQ